MMVVGGYYGGKIDTVEIIDLTGNRPGCLPVAKFPVEIHSTVSAFIDGRVLVCGGVSTVYENRCWTYDNTYDRQV